MLIKIEGVEYTIPVSVYEVTLQQRIDFDRLYGKELQEKLKAIIEMPEGLEKQLEIVDYHGDIACKTLSHFGNIPLDIVMHVEQMGDVLLIYEETMKELSASADFSDQSFQLQNEFAWKDTLWKLAPPELKQDTGMTFGEFLDAKQTVKNLAELGNDNWEALLYLCCVYLRKEGEPYSEALIAEGGERYKLMQSLPLGIALHVGFFLNVSANSYMRTFPSSGQAEASPPGNTSLNTLTPLAG